MDIETLIVAADDFDYDLNLFRARHTLDAFWFKHPDHVAFKASDIKHFEELIEWFSPQTDEMQVSEVDNRFIAIGQLIVGIALKHLGKIDWIEIMEPRPEKVGGDIVGLDHVEFYVDDIETMKKRIATHDSGFDYEFQGNNIHDWVAIKINEQGQEIKFTDISLAEISEIHKVGGASMPISRRYKHSD